MKRALILLLAAIMLPPLLPARIADATVLDGLTSKVDYTNTDPGRYQIEIDLINQVITVYEKDDAGTYTNSVLQGLCTTGNADNPTGVGAYKLGDLKERFGYFVAFGQYAQYWTQVVRGIYIHSIMYDKKDIATLSKSAYNSLGKPLSHGCVRVLPAHAQWIYYNCPPGTACVITKRKAKDAALVSRLKSQKPSYADSRHVDDFRPDPLTLNAVTVIAGVEVRTGFSASKDTTVVKLDAGEAVTVLQLGANWCKVETRKGKLGYAQTKHLSIDTGAPISSQKIYMAKETTHLYSYPGTGAARLAVYDKGAPVHVIGTLGRYWLTAHVDDIYGYVRVKHLAAGAPEGAAKSALTKATGQAVIQDDIIANFRSGPGTSFPVIAELAAGTPVTLQEVSGNWYKAVVNGLEGYIHSGCVRFYQAAAD
ncbi:MAG: SH3 domain-containing protein [Clostridiales bacterium]|jgi:uncharacterized protein YgiM (DUF1202 family)|nr:SH3 domain-containing protein [Clostridiales bacterium]